MLALKQKLLLLLNDSSPCTVSQLFEAMGEVIEDDFSSESATRTAIYNLERSGLVESAGMIRDPGIRSKQTWRLTEAGRNAVESIIAAVMNLDDWRGQPL